MILDALPRGGKERRLLQLIKGLKAEHIHCELVIFSNLIEYEDFYNLDINIHIIKRKVKKDISVFLKFFNLCRKLRPTILHTWESMATVYTIPTVVISGIPLINAMIVDSPQQLRVFSSRWVRSKITFPFSTRIVANSKAGLLAYKAPLDRSLVIRNGFDFKRLDDLMPEEQVRQLFNLGSNKIVGMVAAFSKYKDYRTFLKAAYLLLENKKDLCFICIGDGAELDSIKNSVDSEYKHRIKFLGVQHQVESIVSIFTVGVLSTYTEGISNSIMEYMALAKPVVATDGGGTNELVVENTTGFLVAQNSAAELARKIEQLLDQEALANKMGTAGKNRIHQYFSLKQMTQNYISLYQEISKKE